MFSKKPKLSDATNVVPEHAFSNFAAHSTASVGDYCASSSAVVDDLPHAEGDASIRSIEQHFIAIVQAVLDSLRKSHSKPVPWSIVAVSVA
jgi:hypothetical protein